MMPASIPVLPELFDQVVLVLAREVRGPRQCGQALRTMAIGAKLHCLQSGKRSLIRMHGLRKAHHAKSNTRRDRQGPEANARCLPDDRTQRSSSIACELPHCNPPQMKNMTPDLHQLPVRNGPNCPVRQARKRLEIEQRYGLWQCRGGMSLRLSSETRAPLLRRRPERWRPGAVARAGCSHPAQAPGETYS